MQLSFANSQFFDWLFGRDRGRDAAREPCECVRADSVVLPSLSDEVIMMQEETLAPLLSREAIPWER
jgi:hypothetical protein